MSALPNHAQFEAAATDAAPGQRGVARPLTILEGSTFCICDEFGDIGSFETSGFFDDDIRFLSRLRLTVNGERPLLLESRKIDYFSAAFYLRNPVTPGLAQDALLIARERFIGAGMEEQIVLRNETPERMTLELGLEFGADFADIFTVKERDFALGRPDRARPLPLPARASFEPEQNQLVFCDLSEEGGGNTTQVVLSRAGAVDGGVVRYELELEPRSEWRLTVNVHPSSLNAESKAGLAWPRQIEQRFGDELARVRESLAAWQLRVPQLSARRGSLQSVFERSMADLAALRLRDGSLSNLPAAGMPWFMTLFGRDTIITCLQTLMLGPELARTALRVLAELQADQDDPSIDAEPGKIVHEVRRGKAARAWFPRYYGSIDATPLYLVLLSELWRWTGDNMLVRDLRGPALRALEWIDRYGDRDGDGFLEYERRTVRGLVNQSWKDSFDSQRFADGSLARTPIAPCEVQGYVYDAKRRMAELAREVWRDRALADRLDREAEALRHRFDQAFWIPSRGGYYALALDGDKRPVDSVCSNVGHLLWSGIVPPERVEAVVDKLMGEDLWSGWGIRTMSAEEAAYNPLSYHNGSVWPHDNSLIAWGLARYGRWPELQLIARRMFEAALQFDYQLPEVFAGFRRTETPFPIPYPTPGKPQAWASGTPVLLLQLLLGLQPDPRREALTSAAPCELPSWLGDLSLRGVRAFGGSWDVEVEDGAGRVEAAT
ncbi:MAG: amylo-alpha-1,6-glucosidase [Solirubrobacteraceae bacterium]